MTPDDKHRPAKPGDHGAVRKHDRLGSSDDPAPVSDGNYFNEDGYKVKDVEYVGSRSPDTDPDDHDTSSVASSVR